MNFLFVLYLFHGQILRILIILSISLYNRRILYLDAFELEWIPSTIIEIESLGLPRISQLQPQLIKLLEALEDLVTIDFELVENWLEIYN